MPESNLLFSDYPMFGASAVRKTVFELLRSSGSIVINKRLMRSIGIDCAILFSELLSKESYFEERGSLTEDGYFYCTVSEMEEATTLSEYQQKIGITKLKKLGLINYRVKGQPPVRYFKTTTDMELIFNFLSDGNSKKHPKPLQLLNTEKTTEYKPKKLGTNNTNSIIQNKENDNGVFSEEKDSGCVDVDVVNAMKTYMNDLYKQRTHRKHPYLKPEQYRTVYANIASFANEHNLDQQGIEDMMVTYFNCKSLDTDWNINHFATEGIMMNRMYETM